MTETEILDSFTTNVYSLMNDSQGKWVDPGTTLLLCGALLLLDHSPEFARLGEEYLISGQAEVREYRVSWNPEVDIGQCSPLYLHTTFPHVLALAGTLILQRK